MTLIFFQNIVSPHQITYIRECVKDSRVEKVLLVVPRTDIEERQKMGWVCSSLIEGSGIGLIVAPELEDVEALYGQYPEVVCLYSGIHAFKEIFPWFQLSLKHRGLRRWIITEPPMLWNHPLWQHKLRYYLQDYRYRKSIEGYFCFGELGVDYYRSIYKGWKVCPFQYVTEWVERTLPVPDVERLRVLYVGSLTARKNVSCLLHAVRMLNEGEQKEVEVGLIGDGDKRAELEALAKEEDMLSQVTFYGTKQMTEVPHLMQQYDVLVLPSLHDGWGAVVNEALTLGLYVICSDACGAKYLLKDSQQGLVFESGKLQRLKECLSYCIENKDRIRRTVSDRIAWAKSNISGKASADYFLSCIAK